MNESEIEKIGELIVIEHKTLPILFSEGKVDSLVDEIEKKVRSFVPEIETAKGRKDIVSLAHKIARAKKLIDSAGKQITAEWKAKSKKIDQERSKQWDRLESLQEEIRRPVTEYEERDAERKENHQSSLDQFKNILGKAVLKEMPIDFSDAILSCEELLNSRDWEEFTAQANDLSEKCVLILKEKCATRIAEIERQKREEAERKLKEELDRQSIAEEKEKIMAKAIAEETERIVNDWESKKIDGSLEKESEQCDRIVETIKSKITPEECDRAIKVIDNIIPFYLDSKRIKAYMIVQSDRIEYGNQGIFLQREDAENTIKQLDYPQYYDIDEVEIIE